MVVFFSMQFLSRSRQNPRTSLMWFHYQVLLLNTTSGVPIPIHIIGFKFLSQSSQFWPISIGDFKLHTNSSRASSTYNKKVLAKIKSSLPHSAELTNILRHNKSVKHHVECNRHQVLLPDDLPNQRWRENNIPRYTWATLQAKNICRVRPHWPKWKKQWSTWPSQASRPVPYSDCIDIQPPTTPRILSSYPKWIHKRHHKKTCATEKGAQDTICYWQSLLWRPKTKNPGSLP